MTTNYPRIRRTVRSIGRIQIATGAKSQRQHVQRVATLDALIEADQPALIRALLKGDVTWEELVEHRRERGQFGAAVLGSVKLGRSLRSAVEATLPKMGKSDTTRARYAVTWKRLADLIDPPPAVPAETLKRRKQKPLTGKTVGDLATVEYDILRTTWGRSPSDWNAVGRFLSAFLTKYVGLRHPLRTEVLEAFPRRRERPRVPDISPALFWQIVDAAPVKAKASFVVLLLTGMRVRTEYLRLTRAHLMPHSHRLQVPSGAKTEASEDVVSIDPELWPWIEQGVPPRLTYRWLRFAWCSACVAVGAGEWREPDRIKNGRKSPTGYTGLTLHSLRHALAQFASDAGMGLADVKAALRHTNLSTTEGYARRSSGAKVAGAIGHVMKREDVG